MLVYEGAELNTQVSTSWGGFGDPQPVPKEVLHAGTYPTLDSADPYLYTFTPTFL